MYVFGIDLIHLSHFDMSVKCVCALCLTSSKLVRHFKALSWHIQLSVISKVMVS